MKPYLLALSLLLAGTTTHAQQATPALTLPVDPETHQVTYSGIVAVPNATKSQLYARGKIWFATPSYLVQRVILADDQQANFMVAKVYSYTNFIFTLGPNSKKFWCTIKLYFQDGRYRYLLTDFQFDIAEAGAPLQSQGSIQYGELNQPRYSAEYLCLARRPDGTLTRRATQFSQGFDQQVQRMVASLTSGMAR